MQVCLYPILICGPIFHSPNHKTTSQSLLKRRTVFRALAFCDPPLPGKAIRLCFSLYPKLCLCVSIRHWQTEAKFWQHTQKVFHCLYKCTYIGFVYSSFHKLFVALFHYFLVLHVRGMWGQSDYFFIEVFILIFLSLSTSNFSHELSVYFSCSNM